MPGDVCSAGTAPLVRSVVEPGSECSLALESPERTQAPGRGPRWTWRRWTPLLLSAGILATHVGIWFGHGASLHFFTRDRVYISRVDPITEIQTGDWDESVWIPGLEFLLEGAGWAVLVAALAALIGGLASPRRAPGSDPTLEGNEACTNRDSSPF